MQIRRYTSGDFDAVLALTIDTFESFHEGVLRPLYGEVVFANRHGRWREEYREQVAGLHDPAHDTYLAVAEEGGRIIGSVAWAVEVEKRYGEVKILAVRDDHRGRGLGTALCDYAFTALRARGAEVVSIGTGGTDAFHAPARGLYESLGCTRVDVAIYLRAR